MVKQKTPIARDYQVFRYPGAKSKLAKNPAFRALLDPMLVGVDTFYEGFLGSAAVTLDVALRYPHMKFKAAELDTTISGFWQLIGEGTEAQVDELIAMLVTPPSVPLFEALRKRKKDSLPLSLVERAYHAIFFNRTTFSGISMALPIGGKNQTSKWTITCRYNIPKLQEKIQRLRTLFTGRLTVSNEDCLTWLRSIPEGVPCFLDPPYFVKGSMLYPIRMDEFQHGKLAEILATRKNWIMSYDICDEIRSKYTPFAQLLEVGFRYSINGKKEKHGKGWKSTNEFLITSPEIDSRPFERLCFPIEEASPVAT